MENLRTLSSLAMGTIMVCTGAVAAEVGERISFVSCPIIRDTRTVPCWTSEYEDTTYYLTIQSDVTTPVPTPFLGHKVLVEGVVSDKPQICGGVVIDDIMLTALPEIDANCNTMLPADDRYEIDFNPRPPGPSGGRLAFNTAPSEPPPPPEGPQTIDMYFDFDRGITFRHPRNLTGVMRTAEQIGATRMEVIGFRGAHRLSDGSLLQESESTGQRRAKEVAELLHGAGLDLETTISWTDSVDEADGIYDWQSRRVRVLLTP